MSEFFTEPKALKRMFMEGGERIAFSKNQHLVWQKDKSSWVFFLADGLVRASFVVGTEPERIIGYFVPGAVFAQSGSFISEHDQHLSYTAEQTSHVYRMKQQTFLRRIHESNALMQEYLSCSLKNQIYLIDRIVYQGEKGLRSKLLRWLLFMAKYYGIKSGHGCALSVPLTQGAIANFLHASRESVNVELARLAAEGLVRMERKRITLPRIARIRAALS